MFQGQGSCREFWLPTARQPLRGNRMSVHTQTEIENIKRMVLSLSAVVENRLHTAVKSLHGRDADLAYGVIRGDAEIDDAEVEVEEECLRILALHQPVASDLRYIVAVLKITSDLERIGDLAVNIAKKSLAFAGQTEFQFPFDLVAMSRETESMLRDSLDCLVNLDTDLAHEVCARDEEVNRMKREIRLRAEQEIRSNPQQVRLLLKLIGASRNLERVADLATNIAEDVVYLVDGQIVRHRGDLDVLADEQ
jgi:phosphate transport system protein